MRKIYLDYAATTPLAREVFSEMEKYFFEKFGNASSIHRYGQIAKAALEESRKKISGFIGASPGEIVFVSGGTEADNFAIKGIALKSIKQGKNHIITSRIEHHAVLDCCKYLEKNGFDVTYVDADPSGKINAELIESAIKPETCLISIMLVNNELGTINPVREIGSIAKSNKIVFHTDAVQAFGKIPINVDELNIDLLSLSAHKIYGPKGIGVLYIRNGVELESIIHGGGQERGRRAGTENVALAVAFAKAAELTNKDMQHEYNRLLKLKMDFKNKLLEKFPFILINSPDLDCVPNILNISFDSSKIKIDGEMLLMNLDIEGIALSGGSACTSGSLKPSHVISGIGRDPETAKATLRFSFGRDTEEECLDYTLEILKKVVDRVASKK